MHALLLELSQEANEKKTKFILSGRTLNVILKTFRMSGEKSCGKYPWRNFLSTINVYKSLVSIFYHINEHKML